MTRIVALFLAVLACSFAHAQTSAPMITHCMPVAVRRGSTAEVLVDGQQSFAGTTGWLADSPGLNAEIAPQAEPKPGAATANVKLKITVGSEVPLGPHEFRIVTRHGLSTVGQLVVVDEPVSSESAPTPVPLSQGRRGEKMLPVPGVACGKIAAGEVVDSYRFHADAGKTYTFEVWGARLEDKIHDLQKHLDPHLTLLDSAGRELAVNDDYFFADPYLMWTAPAAGDYYVRVRDSKYEGDPRWVYALCVTDKPFAAHAFPFAGSPGQSIVVEPVGSAAKVAPKINLNLPTEPGVHRLQLPTQNGKTNPVAFVVSRLPQVVEREPNDTPSTAQAIAIPCGISGRIGLPRDLDYFQFKAEKGKPIRFEVKARRFGTALHSPLDSMLEVVSPKGQILASNDDDASTGKDSLLTFMPPADGDYWLRIRDLNGRGGPAFVYYLEADFALPDFTLRCDSDKASVGPGANAAWYVHVNRVNGFTGPVTIEVHGLPPGVTASPLTIPPTMTQGLLVLSASADANISAAANVRVVGTSTSKGPDGNDLQLKRTTVANTEIYLPGGGRGRFNVDLHSVAVTEPGDIVKVNVTPSILSLKPGDEVKLEVTIERRKDFDKDVTLDVPLRHLEQIHGNPLPPGVAMVDSKSKTRLRPGESKGHIVLKVAADAAPIANVPIGVTANVSINFMVKAGYSSAVIPLAIGK